MKRMTTRLLRRRAPRDDGNRYGHDPGPAGSALERQDALPATTTPADATKAAGGASLPAPPDRKPLTVPPGFVLNTSGRSFGFVSPPDRLNPKIRGG